MQWDKSVNLSNVQAWLGYNLTKPEHSRNYYTLSFWSIRCIWPFCQAIFITLPDDAICKQFDKEQVGISPTKKCPQEHSPCFNPPQYKVTGRRGGTFDCFKIPLFCFGRCENSNIPLVYFTFYSTLRFGGTRCGHCIAWPRLERQLFRLVPLFVFVFVFASMFVIVFFLWKSVV